MHLYTCTIESPATPLTLYFKEEKLVRLTFSADSDIKKTHPAYVKKIILLLNNYFKGKITDIDCDDAIELHGSPFQIKIWRALKTIPYGTALTYGKLAKKYGTGPRAVGQACRTNPLPIIFPCHRVIGSGNKLVGFMGDGGTNALGIKKFLLTHENIHWQK